MCCNISIIIDRSVIDAIYQCYIHMYIYIIVYRNIRRVIYIYIIIEAQAAYIYILL